MAFQQVPDTVEVRCVCDFGDQEFVTTYYARQTLPYDAASVHTLAQAVGDSWRDSMMLHLTSDVTFDRVEARDLNTEFGYQEVIEYNTAGTQTGDTCPPQICVVTKLSGDPGGAPRQGRHFISGVKMAVYDLSTNLFDQSIVDSLVVAEEDMTDAIHDAGGLAQWAQVIVSRVHNKSLRSPAATNTIQSISGSRNPGAQRDRRQGIGS
jgi:hypothetical protein